MTASLTEERAALSIPSAAIFSRDAFGCGRRHFAIASSNPSVNPTRHRNCPTATRKSSTIASNADAVTANGFAVLGGKRDFYQLTHCHAMGIPRRSLLQRSNKSRAEQSLSLKVRGTVIICVL